MDPIILGSVAAILLLAAAVYRVLSTVSAAPVSAKSHDEKRRELIESYKRRMDAELAAYADKPERLKKQKALLLKELSLECSRNIFFGPDEVRGVIAELVHYDPSAAKPAS